MKKKEKTPCGCLFLIAGHRQETYTRNVYLQVYTKHNICQVKVFITIIVLIILNFKTYICQKNAMGT